MAEILRIRCRGCQVKIKAPLKYQGRTIQCPQCGHEIKIPVLQAEPKPATTKTAPAKTQATKSSVSRAGAVAAAATPLVVDDAPPTRPKPKPKPKPKEEPIELGDDAYAAAANDPWDIDPAEFDDYEDFEAPPKRKKKPAASSKRSPAKKKKKKKQPSEAVERESSSGGIYIDPSIFGGLALMLLGGGLFWWAWINDYIWPWAGFISVAGLIGMIKGIFGLGDD